MFENLTSNEKWIFYNDWESLGKQNPPSNCIRGWFSSCAYGGTERGSSLRSFKMKQMNDSDKYFSHFELI